MRAKLLLLGVAAGALVAGISVPALAATSADTPATFTLTGGALSVATAANAALTNGAPGDASVTGSLGNVTVTDARGGTAGWTATAASTTFTTAGGPASTGVLYTGGPVTVTGTATVPDGVQTDITTATAAVETATAVSGNNTATWTPTLEVDLPADALAGDYTGTVTTSVS